MRGVKGGGKVDHGGGGKVDHPAGGAASRREASGRRGGCGVPGLLAVGKTIALAVQLQDVDVMGQPVEQSAGQPPPRRSSTRPRQVCTGRWPVDSWLSPAGKNRGHGLKNCGLSCIRRAATAYFTKYYTEKQWTPPPPSPEKRPDGRYRAGVLSRPGGGVSWKCGRGSSRGRTGPQPAPDESTKDDRGE